MSIVTELYEEISELEDKIKELMAQRNNVIAECDILHHELAERNELLRDARGCVQDSANNADTHANLRLYSRMLCDIDATLSARVSDYAKWMINEEGHPTLRPNEYIEHLDMYDLDGMFDEVARHLPEEFLYYDNQDGEHPTFQLGGVFNVIELESYMKHNEKGENV